MASDEVLLSEWQSSRLIESVGRRVVVHVGFARIIDDLDAGRSGEQPGDHAVVDIGEVPALVLRQSRRRGEERVDEDGVDLDAPDDRPEQLARMLAEILVLLGDDLRREVVVGKLDRE